MKIKTLPSFWETYENLHEHTRKQAKKSFELWKTNPFHPSLHFKCVNEKEKIWSLRISKGHRSLCILENDLAIWFWIGNHDEYDRLIQR